MPLTLETTKQPSHLIQNNYNASIFCRQTSSSKQNDHKSRNGIETDDKEAKRII